MMPIKPTPRTRGIRYVDVRLAIPDDSPYPSAGEVVGYLQQQPQPRSALSLSGDDDSTNANNSYNNGCIHSNYYKAPTFDSTTRRHQPAPSSFTFIPLGPSTEDGDERASPATIKGPTAPVFSDNRKTSISHGPNSSRNLQLHQQQQAGVVFSPPPILSTSPSPFEFDSALDYFRKAAPSPAMTATTMDSSEDFSIGFDARSYRTRATPSPSSGSRSRRSFVASPSTAMMGASTSSTMGGFVSPLAIPPTLVEEESTKINLCLSPPSNAIKDKAGRCGATPSPTGSPEYPTPRKSLDFRLAVSPSPIPSAMTTAPPKTCATGSTATSAVLSASTSSSTSANNNAVVGTSTTTTNKKKSPFARDDDSVRKSRIKTELCMHYVRGNPCPFGTGCTYAHGEEELQMTKLMDLHRAGLIDVETYRTKPCLTWISTGSCPFGKRCTGIHDQRAAGEHASWLPHTETQGNTIATDINVDGQHQKRLYSLLYDNPFGSQFSLAFDDWESLYKLVSNTAEKNRRRRSSISAIYKAGIALQMQGPADWSYKFRPQHIIHDELCMVLQKRAFKWKDSGDVHEIPLTSYNPRSPNQAVVREIAFGPDCDPSVRNVALWFNIDDKDVTLCTPQQAKRFRWKRGLNTSSSKISERASSSVFDHLDCFFMVRPDDREAYGLTTRILKHRLGVLRMERSSVSLRERSEASKTLAREKLLLKERIECQLRYWKLWAWPINDGRQNVDDETAVPPVDGYYFKDATKMSLANDSNPDSFAPMTCTATEKIWGAFVNKGLVDVSPSIEKCPWGPQSLPRHVNKSCWSKTKGRLLIFRRLAASIPIGPGRNLPHIHGRKKKTGEPALQTKKAVSESCWQSLLLAQDNEISNEWSIVHDHFERSRSKKVLSILQQ